MHKSGGTSIARGYLYTTPSPRFRGPFRSHDSHLRTRGPDPNLWNTDRLLEKRTRSLRRPTTRSSLVPNSPPPRPSSPSSPSQHPTTPINPQRTPPQPAATSSPHSPPHSHSHPHPNTPFPAPAFAPVPISTPHQQPNSTATEH